MGETAKLRLIWLDGIAQKASYFSQNLEQLYFCFHKVNVTSFVSIVITFFCYLINDVKFKLTLKFQMLKQTKKFFSEMTQ